MLPENIVVFIAKSIFEHVVQNEIWYNRIWRRINPTTKYEERLIKCIIATIQDYEKSSPTKKGPLNKFPFYQSQILFDLLSKHMLFGTGSTELLVENFEKDPNIFKPGTGELSRFYNLFLEKVNTDKILKSLFVEENYKEKIFTNAARLEDVINKIAEIKKDTEKIIHLVKAAIYTRSKQRINR